jgi:hypothetical protein
MPKQSSRAKIQPHQGTVQTKCDFPGAFSFLENGGRIDLQTSVGTEFAAEAAESRSKARVIRFRQRGKEYARAYECCWGHEYNCNRTRIGMYCRALDARIAKGSRREVVNEA